MRKLLVAALLSLVVVLSGQAQVISGPTGSASYSGPMPMMAAWVLDEVPEAKTYPPQTTASLWPEAQVSYRFVTDDTIQWDWGFPIPAQVAPVGGITLNATVVTQADAGSTTVNVRQAPTTTTTGTLIGALPVGVTGTVIAGPITNTNSTTTFWEVKFSVCTGSAPLMQVNCTGWVGVSALALSQPPVTQPTAPPIATISCTPRFQTVSMATFVPTGAKGVTFTVANSGPGTLTLTSASTALPFSVTPADKFPITLLVGQSEQFTATFVPSVKGTFVTNINIFSNSSTLPALAFAVTGVSQ